VLSVMIAEQKAGTVERSCKNEVFLVILQKKTKKNSKVQILIFLGFYENNLKIQILDSQSQQKIVAFQSN